MMLLFQNFDSSGVKQWSKILGGAGLEPNSITIDSNSNLYIAGQTSSNPFDGQATNGASDAFVSKFDSSGIKQWSMIIGGAGIDQANSITIDSNSNLYIAGFTLSNPFDGQATSGTKDAFVSKILTICDISCNDCTISSTNCSSCASNYYKILTNSFPTQCFNIIPSYGYILNNSSYQLCTSYCSGNPVEVTDNLGFKYCDCQCPVNKVNESFVCKASCQNIINHNNNGICEPCSNGYNAHNQSCVASCPVGYLAVSDISNNQYCDTSCPLGLVEEDNICKASCENRGYIKNSQDICNFCSDSKFLLNNACVSECPVKYAKNINFHDCELCTEPLYAYNGKCVTDSECSNLQLLIHLH